MIEHQLDAVSSMEDSAPRKRPRINRACVSKGKEQTVAERVNLNSDDDRSLTDSVMLKAACRRRKIKCDGEKRCKNCRNNDLCKLVVDCVPVIQ